MIKIEFEAATGADLRKEMLDLLGLSSGEIVHKHIIEGHGLELEGNVEESRSEALKAETIGITEEFSKTQEAPKPEPTTRKRRSRAEIEAEAALAANTGSEEPPASTENVVADEVTNTATEEPGEMVITAEDLTKKCVELGRNGKRDAVLAVFESQFGGATISKKDGKPQLTAEQYPAVMEALNALA